MSITQESCECNTKNEFFSKDVFTANLRTLRGEKSQNEMAKIVGLKGQQYWQRLETGATEPNLALLVRISRLFNKPVGVLLGVEQEGGSVCADESSVNQHIADIKANADRATASINNLLAAISKFNEATR